MEVQDLGLKHSAYLGDSVYVGFDGYHIQLMTWNGYPDDPRNKIALEPMVYNALIGWVKRLDTILAEEAVERKASR